MERPLAITCNRCGEPRTKADFQPRRGTCRDCIAEQARLLRTPERLVIIRGRLAAKQAAARALLNELKSKPCLDCGGSFPPVCMHYDHREPATKQMEVSGWCCAGLIPQMLREIERCDLVCANCHAIRTDARHRDGTGLKRGRPRKFPGS